ncbi:MAG: restriction endonuclease [Phycisphaerales bacterium]|nr:restriction endonuclease [Phycisphaerales bacterium]
MLVIGIVVLILGGSVDDAIWVGIGLPIGWWVLKILVRMGRGYTFRNPNGVSLGQLDRMNGKQFEDWISAVLAKDGFKIHDTPHAGDFGVDVLCVPPGSSRRIAIQAKRYKSNVGNAAVQQAIAGGQYYDCAAAAVVTQSFYTKAAKRQAAKADPPVLLIDRQSLGKMSRLLRSHVG